MHWLSVISTICWATVGLAWLAGAIYNAGRAPRVQRKRMSLSSGWPA
ncbi:MAG TPA: hypothetical protein VK821_16660 [Dehalococcoidia bacterium]|nr:hypothetical protein [Dehalococcoidia bacterium]